MVRLEPDSDTSGKLSILGPLTRLWLGFVGLVNATRSTMLRLGKMVWKLGADDPRKVFHGLKVGIALALVSVFYYARPLYDGVGGAAMWAVMTVVVVFEFTVGGSLYKGVNRAIATFTAGALAIGVHWIASKSGETMEPIVRSTSVFMLAATFSRFIPTIKIWFDYGITIFILTFSLVAVSGYRVDELLELAEERLSTIAIGVSICFLVSIFVFPVWAGNDLHALITRNMDKLADSLEGCVDAYFMNDETNGKKESSSKKSQAYKCVLNSKASEDSLANLSKWEPAHGRFSFRHPWSKYQRIGAAMRYCAYCIESLNGCINSEIQAPDYMKNHLAFICIKLASNCSKILKESSNSIKSMQQSATIDFFISELHTSVEELHTLLSQLHTDNSPLIESLPLITVASLLIEIAKRVEDIVDEVDELANAANFKDVDDEKPDKKNGVGNGE
ncbi:aluminum-activated malate transporter 10-like isoform X2 [Asparagus officinalis]|uniref:aluminum-activated malate transporter 10-like isoform X2 n=1 Tax=Asparagus officinalis TaxID=4686 RepID=UPI00098E14D7|nr:aluminum-activated malate transporter 10-like isoform X2 [Asparagus officinalis]